MVEILVFQYTIEKNKPKTTPADPCTFDPSVPDYPQKAAFTIILP